MTKLISIFLFAACLVFAPADLVTALQNQLVVSWVDDGDTIVLKDGRRVRYIGIDAPELANDIHPDQPYARAARKFNERLVRSKNVRLEFDRERTDQYGRLLAYLYVEKDRFVNQIMVSQGYAWVLFRYPNDKYHELLLKAQQKAMSARRGLWQNWQKDAGGYLGNTRSKRFHLESCPFGRHTTSRNRIYFNRQWDAFRQGYAPCSKCLKLKIACCRIADTAP